MPQDPVFLKLKSLQARGSDKQLITVEVLKVRGPQQISVTGLPDSWLKEGLEKIRCLLKQSGGWSPTDQILVHLLPAEAPKFGAQLELPIYLGAQLALETAEVDLQKLQQKLDQQPVVGALTLEGRIVNTQFSEEAIDEDPQILGPHYFSNIDELMAYFRGEEVLGSPCFDRKSFIKSPIENLPVHGLEAERFWISCAAIADTAVILMGPPGVGKSHLARWAHTILPPLDDQSRREVERLWRAANLDFTNHRPVIMPHSRTRYSDFIGTQSLQQLKPGLYALAHRGLMILDEFHELNRDCRELLRTVLDQKRILKHTRAGTHYWPADFWAILTANPCECGYSEGRDLSRCSCLRSSFQKYQSRLSGPLLDRMGVRRFVLGEKSTVDAEDLSLFQRLLGTNEEDLRSRMAEWKAQFQVASAESLEEAEKVAAGRQPILEKKLRLALKVTKLYSESEIDRFMKSKRQHEKRYFQLRL